VSGDATYSFTNLYQSGAPQEAVKTTADAAFGALATWLSEQQRLVERAFEVRARPRRATRRRSLSQLLSGRYASRGVSNQHPTVPRSRRWSATR
jgi:hypothetical protein